MAGAIFAKTQPGARTALGSTITLLGAQTEGHGPTVSSGGTKRMNETKKAILLLLFLVSLYTAIPTWIEVQLNSPTIHLGQYI